MLANPRTGCPSSPLCNWEAGHNWTTEKIYTTHSNFTIVECFSCKSPMIVWFSCKEPSKQAKLLTLKAVFSKFGTKVEIKGVRTKYDHPHEHILLT